MRRTPTSARTLSAALVIGGLTLTSCDSLPFLSSHKNKTKIQTASATQPSGTDTQNLSAQARLQAERLKRAMAQGNGDANSGDGTPEVKWIDLRAEARHADRAGAAQGNMPASITGDLSNANHAPSSARTSQNNENVRLDRHALVSRLLEEIRAGHAPALAKAVAATGLTLVEPGSTLDPGDLAGLTGSQREQVRRYFDIVNSLSRQLISDGRLPEGDELASQLQSADGSQPVRVRAVHLCRRVSGYGVYDAFDSTSFLAGHEQPVIIYVELDQFRSTKGADDLFHVKLAQEVTLYNEADGLAVWHQPSVEIADDSHNRRRDFFLVQLIKFPANLTVGKYRLNVRVTDMTDSSLDELKVPLQIVADESMVSSSATR